eukprot:5599834-Prymnesium_polylepis.1
MKTDHDSRRDGPLASHAVWNDLPWSGVRVLVHRCTMVALERSLVHRSDTNPLEKYVFHALQSSIRYIIGKLFRSRFRKIYSCSIWAVIPKYQHRPQHPTLAVPPVPP